MTTFIRIQLATIGVLATLIAGQCQAASMGAGTHIGAPKIGVQRVNSGATGGAGTGATNGINGSTSCMNGPTGTSKPVPGTSNTFGTNLPVGAGC